MAAANWTLQQSLDSEFTSLARYSAERSSDTCEWLFRRDEYVRWAATSGHICLWISGAMGSGKTVLASAIIESLRDQKDTVITAFCFFEEGLGKDDFALHLLKVLIGQLQDHDVTSNYLLHSILPEIGSDETPVSSESFRQILRELLENLDSQVRVVLVLDGLVKDKWISTVVLDEVLRSNNSRSRATAIRCVVSSREPCDWKVHKGHVTNISLNNDLGVQQDVLHFAESRLNDICSHENAAKVTSLAKKICLQGRGVFLWVALVIESLHSPDSFAQWNEELQFLPPTLGGLYRLKLENISSDYHITVQRLFCWLLAARREMQLTELLQALVIEPKSQVLNECEEVSMQSTLLSEFDIVRICSPLTVITRNSTVKFRHPSIRRYLSNSGEAGEWAIPKVQAHRVLARTCFALMTFKKHDIRVPSLTSRSMPLASRLADYAYTNWTFHYAIVEPHDRTIAGVLHHCLMMTLRRDCRQFSLPEIALPMQIATTTLRIAACHGFTSLAKITLEMGADPNGRNCASCAPPLALAIAGGHSKAAALLLQQGASPTVADPRSGETALHHAAAYGLYETAMMLLKAGAQANSAAGILHRTPLHIAAFSGHLQIVKLLLDFEADVNAVIPESGETALHLAALFGHIEIVKWLLEGVRPSKPELDFYESMTQQRYFQDWLHTILTKKKLNGQVSWDTADICAAQQEMENLQSLCRSLPDINSRTLKGHTALHLAAANGHDEIVQFLLSKGANPSIDDHKQATALEIAAISGHLQTVTLLLRGPTDSQMTSACFGATLETISNSGYDATADLLAWYQLTVKELGQPYQWPISSLPIKAKCHAVRDAISRRSSLRRKESLSRRGQRR